MIGDRDVVIPVSLPGFVIKLITQQAEQGDHISLFEDLVFGTVFDAQDFLNGACALCVCDPIDIFKFIETFELFDQTGSRIVEDD